MEYEDIVPFLQDVLYGLDWSHEQLEHTLDTLFASGRGVLDPASLVPGFSG